MRTKIVLNCHCQESSIEGYKIESVPQFCTICVNLSPIGIEVRVGTAISTDSEK